MLTLFSIPKHFKGDIAIIQRNAIRSWLLLRPQPEIILFGKDEGTAEIAKDLDIRHIPEVRLNEYGTPLVNDIFEKAQIAARNKMLCYVNCDIILMSDFMDAIRQVIACKNQCLIIGSRRDIDVRKALDFSQNWEDSFKSYMLKNCRLHAQTGIDYFVFPQGFYKNIPSFAIGRTVWDNWLVYFAASKEFHVVDISGEVIVAHQRHDYSHAENKDVWNCKEAKENFKLAGNSYIYLFDIKNATHRLTAGRLKSTPFSFFYIELVKLYNSFALIKPLVILIKRIREKMYEAC